MPIQTMPIPKGTDISVPNPEGNLEIRHKDNEGSTETEVVASGSQAVKFTLITIAILAIAIAAVFAIKSFIANNETSDPADNGSAIVINISIDNGDNNSVTITPTQR